MHNYFQVFISLFFLMNPLLSLPIYLSIIHGLDRSQKRLVLIVCGITAFSVLMVSLFIGQKLMQALGIHQYALQLAGGLIVLLIGLTIVLRQDSQVTEASNEGYDRNKVISLGISPLALPMIVGPASMALMMLYGNEASGVTGMIILAGIALLVTLIVVIMLGLADFISKAIGHIGVTVINKIMGLFITAIAFEMLAAGIKGLVPVILVSH